VQFATHAKLKVDDYYHNGARRRLRLHEKGGKEHEMPVHHLLEEILNEYIVATAIMSFVRIPPRFGLPDIGTIMPEVGLGPLATGDIEADSAFYGSSSGVGRSPCSASHIQNEARAVCEEAQFRAQER
jgi:hypothetical protein